MAEALEAHRLCWQLFLDRRGSKADPITITPEFDGYYADGPFSAEPLADVDAINVAMTLASDDDAFVDPGSCCR